MTIHQYFESINKRFQSGISTEHSYRGDLQLLLESLCVNSDVTNEPTRIACGAPDYILTKKGDSKIPVGYIEAKDLSESMKLETFGRSDQLMRYRSSLNNLILCNYIEFFFFLNGEKVTNISIAKIEGKKLIPVAENWPAFENLIRDFSNFSGITIKSAQRLAEMMASKARVMQQVLQSALESDDESLGNSSLKDQMQAFKNILIHDINPGEFADIYAQTIAYGLFAARLNDNTIDTFTRQEASELIPKNNPFLKKLFGYIAGVDIDDRIVWIVDALAEVFRAADVAAILKNFGKATRMEDPVIHFYETFLASYNPKLRKSRGVWYTPEPIVNFIVRSVDEILINEFDLPRGLADNTKIKIKRKHVTKATSDKRSKIKEIDVEESVHQVQILDPATGTGTFLAEVIRFVYSKFDGQKGIWSKYTEEHLIPRLHGFELLMASYAMAHLKLDLLLKETGYKPTKAENRLGVYLTNSLEEAHPDAKTLFASWLSQEATEANNIKRETPVMVVLGNPPYSVSSSNRGEWIQNLLYDYKKNLLEKKINLDDDYIKFIRYSQYLIQKNGRGIIALITNNTFIDAVTCRQMRNNLAETFDKIYILDLHGSTKKKEVAPDGTKDENVFDIQQGVSISLFIKNGENKDRLAKIYHSERYGKRETKYEFLGQNSYKSIDWAEIILKKPYFFFIPTNSSSNTEYEKFISLTSLFLEYGSGVKNERDKICVQFSLEEIEDVVNDFRVLKIDDIRNKYDLGEDSRDWKISKAKEDVINHKSDKLYQRILYRPFDLRFTYFTGTTRGFIGTPGTNRMKRFVDVDNVGLITCRQQSTFDFQHVFVTKYIADICALSSQTKETCYLFPLYLYNHDSLQFDAAIQPNFNLDIVNQVAADLGARFYTSGTPFEKGLNNNITPLDILDYAYAILHAPTYRKKYKTLLKIDFPRIPFTKDLLSFRHFCVLGSELRKLHSFDFNNENLLKINYPVNGSNLVEFSNFREGTTIDGQIFINDLQYFSNVPTHAWNFYIGGYQPLKKWIKDRKGRILDYDDILTYQKMIFSLVETLRIMEVIEEEYKVFEASL